MSDDSRVFQTGAKRDNADGKGRMDLLPWNAIIELSKHCERGAKHYGENNVRMGIPFHSLADSGARHLAKWIAGVQDEPTHLVAACWNLMWLLEQTITKPELNDMPWGKVEDNYEDIIALEIPNNPNEHGKYQTKDGLWHEGIIPPREVRYAIYNAEHPDDKADRLKKIAESGDAKERYFAHLFGSDDPENEE